MHNYNHLGSQTVQLDKFVVFSLAFLFFFASRSRRLQNENKTSRRRKKKKINWSNQ